ncbi:hypothetical protein [Sphingomonas sp. M1-B02]|uniref:hypothetical protein n=1 Tax=Sphingomonas sp. M1-B02 TaxID=3114300 RepID=UPI00223E9061|nr:hypothetical protein [Sphingomonas sp. S6-11]UZK65370.1 hypothetical protein OKW87_12730 [Sphingomonas sp. S6-11]
MRLAIKGAASPEFALRVLNLLAQQDVTVERALIELVGDRYRLSLDTAAAARDDLIVEKIGAMILVHHVERLDVVA